MVDVGIVTLRRRRQDRRTGGRRLIDLMIGLSFAAAATSTIGIATGVLLLPEHNPVIVAKQAASLDRLSGGRFSLGVGIGWSREEFDALRHLPCRGTNAEYVCDAPCGATISRRIRASSRVR